MEYLNELFYFAGCYRNQIEQKGQAKYLKSSVEKTEKKPFPLFSIAALISIAFICLIPLDSMTTQNSESNDVIKFCGIFFYTFFCGYAVVRT